MLQPLVIGLVAGQRAMTPLAVLAGAARQGELPGDTVATRLLGNPLVAAGAVGLGALEMAGDKMATAPDRTAFLGLAARSLTSAFAGAVLSEHGQRARGAAIAVAAAIAGSYVGLALRQQAAQRLGRVPSGFVEDALVLSAGMAAVRHPR